MSTGPDHLLYLAAYHRAAADAAELAWVRATSEAPAIPHNSTSAVAAYHRAAADAAEKALQAQRRAGGGA